MYGKFGDGNISCCFPNISKTSSFTIRPAPCPRCSYATLALPSGFAGADPGTERCPRVGGDANTAPMD